MSDKSNYGDDKNAGNLLTTNHLASFGLDENEFSEPRSRDYIKDLFSCCCNEAVCPFDALFDSVSLASGGGDGTCSIAAFRDAYVSWMIN
jgi:hypothetical protein